jgi:hypothetical protein
VTSSASPVTGAGLVQTRPGEEEDRRNDQAPRRLGKASDHVNVVHQLQVRRALVRQRLRRMRIPRGLPAEGPREITSSERYSGRAGPICGARTGLAMPKKLPRPWPPHRVESTSLGTPKQLLMSCLGVDSRALPRRHGDQGPALSLRIAAGNVPSFVDLIRAQPNTIPICDPHDRLKVVCAFVSDLARARGTVLRPPARFPPLEAFGRRPPNTRRRPSSGRHPKPFTQADIS